MEIKNCEDQNQVCDGCGDEINVLRLSNGEIPYVVDLCKECCLRAFEALKDIVAQ